MEEKIMFYEKNVYDLSMGGKNVEVVLTNEARWGCQDNYINKNVMLSLIPEAEDYVLGKEISERFTIVSEELRTVLTGIITFKSKEDLGVLITNVYGDIHIIRDKQDFVEV